jgi:starch synthase
MGTGVITPYYLFLLSAFSSSSIEPREEGMPLAEKVKVLYLASEADPLIKVGGLGDVAGSLPYALLNLDPARTGGMELDLRLAVPFHAAIRQKLASPELVASFEIGHSGGSIPVEVFATVIKNLTIYLVSAPLFGPGEPVYTTDSYRDGTKYTLFTLAALELTRRIGWIPDIIHANDWHTAIASYFVKYDPDLPELKKTRTILSIHNLPYLGAGTESALEGFSIPPSQDPNLPNWARLMPMPLGLVTADRLIAVSSSYAREIMTPEFGCGLEGFLQTRRETISGILNGLDEANWDPATDPALPTRFSAQTLELRVKNREALLRELALDPDPAVPLIIIVSRMDHQKGIDLAIDALYQIASSQWQAVILGTGSPLIEATCQHFQEVFPKKVRAILRFDNNLSRRMYAGGDMILMPSRYEPCGLTQMIAMRYGCVPIARATGGLRDTILDIASPGATGFLFKEASAQALAETILQALKIFPDRREWKNLQLHGMQMDFNWQRSANAYAQVYQSLKEEIV